MHGVLKSFEDAQRKAIIRERRLEGQERAEKERESQKLQHYREAHINDQIAVLQENLADKRREAGIQLKAQSEETRRLVAEQKQLAKSRIALIRSKLASDWDGDENRISEISRLRAAEFRAM